MTDKCKSYHIESKRKYTYHPITGDPIRNDITVGVCWGTKEIDECNCNGDETMCDFYPEVRDKARKELANNNMIGEDALIVTYDSSPSDVPTLCIARKEKNRLRVLNTIQGNAAFGIYEYLKGNAYLRNNNIQTIADDIRSMSDEELAELLAEGKYNNKKIDVGYEICHKGICLDDETCVGCMLKWLQKPIEKEQ